MPNWKNLFAVWQNKYRHYPLRKRILALAALFVILVILSIPIYYVIAFCAVSPAEYRLAELAESWRTEALCHEACQKRRQEAEREVAQALASGSEARLPSRLKAYFLDSVVAPEFKTELIRLMRSAYGTDNPPDYVRDFLSDPASSPAIQAEIIVSFSPAALAGEDSTAPLDYYFGLLAGNHSLKPKLAAVRSLSNYADKAADFSIGQLTIIKKIVLSPATDSRLRAALVMLLSEYYPFHPEETVAALREIYRDQVNPDKISRAFSADILNRKTGVRLPLPEISEAEWSEYYND
ncbi:MAG: hypothetical protein WC456_03705 [Patescibacteria group bacterium]